VTSVPRFLGAPTRPKRSRRPRMWLLREESMPPRARPHPARTGRMSSGLPVAERVDEPARLGAVEHDRRGRAVPEGARARRAPDPRLLAA
jgi:hypothetical protein